MGDLSGPGRSILLQVHKSVGIAILVLTAGRLVWRLVNPPPPHASDLNAIERRIAHAAHVGFYGLLLALPLTGWAMVSMQRAGGVRIFGVVNWPSFPLVTLLPGGVQDTLSSAFDNIHALIAWVMLGLLALHVAGALKHHFLSKDRTLARMAPGAKPGALFEPRLIAIPAALAALAAVVYAPPAPQPISRPIPKSLAEADVYLDIVGPALDRRCSACHSDDVSQGGLSLTSYDAVMHGGRIGRVVIPGDAGHSDLLRRISLPSSHADYMPKGERPPLSPAQIDALRVWIEVGAPKGLAGTLKLTDAQKATLQKALPSAGGEGDDNGGLPSAASLPVVLPSDALAVTAMENSGFIVRKVDKATNLVDVDFNGLKPATDADFANLAKIGPQILNLNLRGAGVTDAQMKTIGTFTHLRTLRLQENPVTDAGLAQIAKLGELQDLSLISTKVSGAGISTLGGLKALKSVYLWNTAVTPADVDRFKAEHKGVVVSGGVQAKDVVKDTVLRQPAN